MADVKDVERIKQRVEALKSKIQRSQGAKEEALRQLKEEFEVDNLEDAKTLLEDLEKRERVAQKKFDKSLQKFEDDWQERIEA